MKKLPKLPGLRPRESESGRVYYYLKTDPALKEIPLGKNLQRAIAAWQAYRMDRYVKETKLSGILKIIGCFRVAEIPLRDATSQTELLKQVGALEGYFLKLGHPGPSTLMLDARSYLEHRGANFSVSAGGEVRLLIHIWTWATRHSLVAEPCPWTSDAVTEDHRRDVQGEIGDALRWYAYRDAAARPEILQCLLGPPASTPQIGDSDLLAWARVIAIALRDDGRRDMARAVRKLAAGELRVLLAPHVECGFERGQLILGTQRSPQLKAHRTLSDHKRKAGRQSPDACD